MPKNLTLIDWFAGQTIAGLALSGRLPQVIAQEAYAIAEAMIQERKKHPAAKVGSGAPPVKVVR